MAGSNKPDSPTLGEKQRAWAPATGHGVDSAGLVDAMKDKAKEVATGAGELVRGAKEKVQEWAAQAGEVAGQVKDKAQQLATTAVHKAEDLGHNVTDLIRRYPWQALLIGFGIGVLAAQVLRRSK